MRPLQVQCSLPSVSSYTLLYARSASSKMLVIGQCPTASFFFLFVFFEVHLVAYNAFSQTRAVRVEGNFKKHTQTNISWHFKCLQAQEFTINIQTRARSSATPLLISLSLFISVRGNKQVALLSLSVCLQILRQINQSKHFILTVFLFTSVNNAFFFLRAYSIRTFQRLNQSR